MDPNLIMIPLAVLQTGYMIVGFHLDRSAKMQSDQRVAQSSHVRPLVMFGFTFLTWSALGLNYIDRNYIEPQQAEAVMVSYGVQSGDNLAANVVFRNWSDHKKDKAILITRVPYSDKDRMMDDWIAKSTLYTITQPAMILSVVLSKGNMHFAASMPNSIEYDLAVVPADTEEVQIARLSDIGRLGGKILAVAGQGGIMGGPPNSSAPEKSN